MKENQYVIISKTAIQKRIEECNKYLSFVNKEHDTPYQKEIDVLQSILSQSVLLIPENIKPLQELVDEGYDPYDSAHHLQVQKMLKVIQDYIANLKLDI